MDDPRQVDLPEWLGQAGDARIEAVGNLREARRKDDRNVRPIPAQDLGQLRPTPVGHGHVAQDEVDPLLSVEDLKRLPPGRRVEHAMPEIVQHRHGVHQHEMIVIDDEDREQVLGAVVLPLLIGLLDETADHIGRRKPDFGRGADVWRAVQHQLAA